jgi:hypothetical protein
LYVYMSRRTVMANIGRKGPTRLAGKLRIRPTGSKARRYIKSLQVHGSGQDIVGKSMAPRLGDLGLTARHSAGSRKSSLTTPPPCMINNLSKLQNTLYVRMTRETITTDCGYSCRSQLFGSMGFLLTDSLRLEETSCRIMPRMAVTGVYVGLIPP